MNFVYQPTLFPNQIPVHYSIYSISYTCTQFIASTVKKSTNQNTYNLSYKVLTVMDFHPQSHGRNPTEKAKRFDKSNP